MTRCTYFAATLASYNGRLADDIRGLLVMSATNGSNGNDNKSISPHGIPSEGIPKLRQEWIARRREEAARSGDGNLTQMHFARKGQVTEEMLFVAEREKISPELVRSKIAEGKLIIPANINHPELQPMCIGVDSLCKINANIGNSSVSSNVQEELKKLHTSVHYGADTMMDLSTGGDIHGIRETLLRHCPVPMGTVPIYEAVARVKRIEDLSAALMLEVIEEQAAQGVDYMTIHAGVLVQYLPLVASAHHRHRQPRRRDAGAVDGPPPQAELPLRVL